MYNWFECKIKYDRVMENGMVKSVTEPYLVDAISFTEAEERIVEEMKPFISGEFNVAGIRRKKFTDTFLSENGDRYYNVRLGLITLDEKIGLEKKTSVNILVQASTIKEAVEMVEMEMKKTMVDYVIMTVSETAIIDIFPFTQKEQ